MSESQFPRSLFPQFTEEDFKEASENFKSYVNWTEYNKWVEAGSPYEEHDEILMNLNLEHNESSQTRSTGKSILLFHFHVYVWSYSQTYKILF